jgi:DNA-binding LacI/PurR family transcriptional regulator
MARPARPGQRPTIYDVAEHAGVSKSLVSLVLRGSSSVSDASRAAVLAAISELDYRPSQAATMLASARSRTIEMLIDDYRNTSFVGLVDGVRDAVADHDYYVTVTETRLNNHPTDTGHYRPASPADGRILAAEPGALDLTGWVGPVVVAGLRGSIPPGAVVVASDDAKGSQLACEHMLALGHREIGHLSGTGGPAKHRRTGYSRAMRAAGLPARVFGTKGGTTEEDGFRSALELLKKHPETTAIVAANDVMALGALAAARIEGRSVPDDLSVVGYDNSPVAKSRYLSLTSIDDRSNEVGRAAAEALLTIINNSGTPPTGTRIEPALVLRGSTAPCAT